jgi:hypothetical protein
MIVIRHDLYVICGVKREVLSEEVVSEVHIRHPYGGSGCPLNMQTAPGTKVPCVYPSPRCNGHGLTLPFYACADSNTHQSKVAEADTSVRPFIR